jgi:alkylation response protein AidB-like acyl-CoA dehydrogenase
VRVDFVETDEQLMLREAVSGIARRYGPEYFVEQSRSGGQVTELWDELGAHGFFGVNLPVEHGGGGMGIGELAIVEEECSAAGCPLLILLVSSAICGTLITRFGTVEQQQRWLPDLAAGRIKMAFAITEPDAGSNSHQIGTTAVRAGDGYRLDGTKYYISGVDDAAAMVVVARTAVDERTGRAQLSLFIVDTDAAGLQRQPIPVEIVSPDKQFTLFFDGVEIGPDRLLGPENGGLEPLFAGLNPERILSAALSNGLARFALDRAAAYATDRVVWGTPIGAHQGIAHPLAKAKVDVELARLMTTKAAWCFDHGLDAGEASNMAKVAAADAAIAALDQAIQTHGGNGMATEYGLAPMWGLARLLRIAPVSREMILSYVAQHSLRLPRSY